VDLRFALVKAAAAGNEGVIRGLLDAGVCDPPAGPSSEEPEVRRAASLAFNTAAERGHLAICRLMLERRVPLQPDTLSKALMSSASNPQSTALLQLLLEKGVDANAGRNGFDSSSTPLGKAIDAENLEGVRLLLKAGAHLRNGFCTGFSALHSAAYTGNAELIRLLVAAGAKDPDSGAMQHAIRTGKWGIVEVLMGSQKAAG
jgi:ankyrin repeat protein